MNSTVQRNLFRTNYNLIFFGHITFIFILTIILYRHYILNSDIYNMKHISVFDSIRSTIITRNIKNVIDVIIRPVTLQFNSLL